MQGSTGDGLALKLELTRSFNLASILSFNAEFGLYINTTGEDYVYTVPERLQDDVGYSTVTITAGAPQLDGSEGPAGVYLVLMGSGDLTIASFIDLDGEFYIEISEHELELQVNATANFFLGTLAASGLLKINDEGVIGSLQLGLSAGTDALGADLFSITGTFQSEINSTDEAQPIKTLDIADDGTVRGFAANTEYGVIEVKRVR